MYLLLANDVNYLGPIYDPLFTATGVFNDSSDPNNIIYFGDYFITTLVCLDQFQFCNPQNGQCTAEADHMKAWDQGRLDLGLNDYQMAVLWRIEKMFIETFTFNAGIGSLGVTGEFPWSEPKETEKPLLPIHPSFHFRRLDFRYPSNSLKLGLLANEVLFKGKLSPALPSDQWIREVQLWFETALSILQELTLGFVDISAFNNTEGAFKVQPVSSRNKSDREAAEWQCTAQKVRARGRAQNINVAGLIIIVATATTIVLAGLLLEPCVGIYRGLRKRQPGQLRQFARATDNLYWLLHAGLRGSGAGQWRYGSYDSIHGSEVPIIDDPVCFGPPVNDDSSWALFYRLQPPKTAFSVETGLPSLSAAGGRSPATSKVESPP